MADLLISSAAAGAMALTVCKLRNVLLRGSKSRGRCRLPSPGGRPVRAAE